MKLQDLKDFLNLRNVKCWKSLNVIKLHWYESRNLKNKSTINLRKYTDIHVFLQNLIRLRFVEKM